MDQNERFEWHRQKIAEAGDNGNYKKAVHYAKKALEEDGWDLVHKWMFFYDAAIVRVTYDKEIPYEETYRQLAWLRQMACRLDEEDQAKIIDPYMDVLRLILSLQMPGGDELESYEDVASELWKLADFVEPEPEDGLDLFSLAALAMAYVYDRKGQIMMKEAQLRRIWDRVPGNGERTDITLSEQAIDGLVVLVETYEQMGKTDEAVKLTFFLLGYFLDGTLADGWYGEELENKAKKWMQTLLLKVVGFGAYAGADMQIDMMESFLFRHNLVQPAGLDDFMWIVYSGYLGLMDRKGRSVPRDLLKKIEQSMQAVSEEQLYTDLTNNLLYTYYIGCYFTAKALGHSDFMEWLDQAAFILTDEETPEPERMLYLNSMRIVIYEYYKNGLEAKAVSCAYNIMGKLARFYSLSEWSRDNREMERYLHCCYGGFMTAYSLLLEKAAVWQRLEYSMNYKNILCAVLRARNKCPELAGRKKRTDEMRYYTYPELTRCLQKGDALIDFLYTYRDLRYDEMIKHGERLEHSLLEIIVVANDGECRIQCGRLEDAVALQGRIYDFLGKVKRPDVNYKKAAKSLYKDILEPFADILSRVRRLWLSPDLDLCNIPFEVLMEVSGLDVADLEIVYLQSVREIFSVHRTDGRLAAACVVGNPDFGAGFGQYGRAQGEDGLPSPLPYSGYEARKISRILNGRCFLQEEAVKSRVCRGYRCLHIATHGVQTESADNPWYGSALLFAGRPGSEKDGRLHDSGTLTAEEISRMDLLGTEMVVLSACHSGSSVFSVFEQQAGLHVAFGAAGAGYVVSALWEADDLATAIFMFCFYTEIAKGCPVPEALRGARQALWGTTAGDVLRMLDKDWDLMRDADVDGLKRELENIPERYALYRSPYYWANFVCYRY